VTTGHPSPQNHADPQVAMSTAGGGVAEALEQLGTQLSTRRASLAAILAQAPAAYVETLRRPHPSCRILDRDRQRHEEQR